MQMKNLESDSLPVKTTDGFTIRITTQIYSHNEVEETIKYGPEGIGLFSTDYLYENRTDLPSEDEQFEIYRQVSQIMTGKPVVIRTLNSPPPNISVPQVNNPALGFRGIRIGIHHPDILKNQLRAILRANVNSNLKILLPGVAHFSELLKVKELLSQIRQDLDNQDILYKTAEIGIAADIPSTVFNAEKMGNEASFFCISPKLNYYTMAVDPDSLELSYLFEKFDPVFLRMAQSLIETGSKRWKKISLYGPLTGEMSAITILLGIGLNEIIVTASEIPKIKNLVRNVSMMEAKKIAAKALSFNNADSVKQYAQKSLKKLLK